MARHIGFLVYPGFDILDLSGPLEVFQWAEHLAPGSYRLTVMSMTGGEVASSAPIRVLTEPALREPLDTLVVVGGTLASPELSAALVDYIGEAAWGARRTASVCTGAFLLAATGLLDGRSATTHWMFTARLQAMYPAVRVDGDRIFINEDRMWTSAGVTAGIDLSLALIEEDLGLDIARAVARGMVVYHRRPGGQQQYSSLLDLDPASDRIRKVLCYARDHLADGLSVERLAQVAHLSQRQFGRAFLAATGVSPAKAIDRLRAEVARPRVEEGREPLDEIARSVGYADAERMRQSFLRVFGYTPQTVRRTARA